ELHPVPLLVLVVAEALEDAQDRLRDRENLVRGQEREELAPAAGQDRGAAPDRDLEAAARASVRALDTGAEADVVDGGLRGVLGAALEGDLELAGQRGREGMAEEKARERLGVGRHVERLLGGNSGPRAGRDVAHGVAAGLAGREAGFGQPPHRAL